MNKIIEKNINYMFDHGIASITERKNEEQMLTPTAIFILTNGETIRAELPTYLTGEEQMLTITGFLKEAENGSLIFPDGQKNNNIKVGGFLYFFESWASPGESNIRPTYHPDRQTAIGSIAGDVDGYYHGIQTINTCNGKSVVGNREIKQFNLNDNCSGRFVHILNDSALKFKKMDDEAISKAIMEIP
jgi:hypothetical protein